VRRFRTDGWVAIALVGALCQGAFARDAYCVSTHTSDADRWNALDAARKLARPHRIATETFGFCSRRSLGGRSDQATVETVRRQQPDGSETWVLVLCTRRYGESKWPCTAYEQRAIRMPVSDAAGTHVIEVEMRDADAAPPMAAALARELVIRAFDIARRPPPGLAGCDSTPGDFSGAWNGADALSVWTDGESQAGVSRELGATLEFARSEASGRFEPKCWRAAVLVVE